MFIQLSVVTIRRKRQQSHNSLSTEVTQGSGSKIMIEYNGYNGKVELDEETGVFYGEVINL